ncbi:hypothetical protein CRT60_23210 [Azospirillum palustre]|uniref:Uncharacterized protein n=1 Tax=Azospirillum palustre TaxID=2044885 RepID=A0A2B8B4G6_9PROT|nr:hypothetical protein CRT60_23210 [Azospirillum palustre]
MGFDTTRKAVWEMRFHHKYRYDHVADPIPRLHRGGHTAERRLRADGAWLIRNGMSTRPKLVAAKIEVDLVRGA